MIRPATFSDVPGLVAAIDAAYAPYRAAGLDLPPVSEGLEDDIRDHLVWVAAEEDRVLGGIVMTLHDDHAHLANLAVHPDGAGRGLGRALIDTAQRAARDAGCVQMRLATHRDMTATQAFYARLGWVETGRDGHKVYFSINL